MPKTKRKPAKKVASRSRPRRQTKQFLSESTAIVPATPRPIIVQKNRERQLTSDEIELLKRTVCKGADDDEFALFLWTCRKHKLDPITRQIYAVFRNVSKHHEEEKTGEDGGKFKVWVGGRQMTIQMGIDGLRALAGRHHKDFGGCDEPVFEMSEKITPAGRSIPDKATVKLWKKGFDHAIVGVAYWEEFAPRELNDAKADFYNRMPKHMLAKCAEALAIRKGYPDLSDIYTDAEMVQAQDDYTPQGRLITDENGFTRSGQALTYQAQRLVAKEAQRQVLNEKLAHGHEPGSEKAKMAEATLARVEEEDRKLKEQRAQKLPGSNPGREASHVGSQGNEPGGLNPPDAAKFHLEIDHNSANGPIVRGDAGDILPLLEKFIKATWGADEFWHVRPQDVDTIHAASKELGSFSVTEILPKSSPVKSSNDAPGVAGARSEAGTAAQAKAPAKDSAHKEGASPQEHKVTPKTGSSRESAPGPIVVKGVIEQFVEKMTKGTRPNPEKGKKGRPSVPYLTVLIKTEKGSQWVSAFDHTLFPFIQKGKISKKGEFVVQKSGDFWNLLGFRTLESLTFDEDNKTTCIQRDREPGFPKLFEGD